MSRIRKTCAVTFASIGMVLAGLAALPAPSASAAGQLDVIVTLKPGADAAATAQDARRTNGARVQHVYTEVLNGFAASIPQAALGVLRNLDQVARVEIDRGVQAFDSQQPTPSWGLDRIDQRNLPGDDEFTYTATGSGVTAYVVDTGIQINHPDFEGRASHGTDTIDGDTDATDCNGHGTHVAGTIGGEAYGVAKDVDLVGVRVLDCNGSGSTAGVIAGLDWVVANHQGGPAVANMSLGGGSSVALDNAVQRVIDDGITMAVAAGNSNADACGTSPARVPAALTVGASGENDARASFSNVGDCVDLFAPGVDITSTWLNNSTNTISGTSMASPHVAGVAAQYLSTAPGASPNAVNNEINANSSKDRISDTDGGCVFLFLGCTPATPNNHVLFTDY
ncbi:S8 family peptidase [Nocardioides panacisoli]|uniref:S8 family peptidase n=1 Tax=Nocardioides panacisoli TaxID=627624 RepID=UPI001C62A7BB|nr:S8 family peptidase [Nocardioides panacisoli]QYJ04353.1 S8 family peptidase [Nocardioides panacisoli]